MKETGAVGGGLFQRFCRDVPLFLVGGMGAVRRYREELAGRELVLQVLAEIGLEKPEQPPPHPSTTQEEWF